MQAIQIKIRREDDSVSIQSPYSETNNNEYRSRGGKFDRSTSSWNFPASPSVEKMIKELYGTSEELVTVKIQYNGRVYGAAAPLQEHNNAVQLGGYVLMSRRGRDSQVSFAPGVVLYAGRFTSSGGSVKNPCVGTPKEPVTLHATVRADFALRHNLEVL